MLPKINSNRFCGIWIGLGIGVAVPAVIRLLGYAWPVVLSLIGGGVILVFLTVRMTEMKQDRAKESRYDKELRKQFPFDPEKQEAVIRCSVCTGEKVAGFRNREDGHFSEVMLLRTPEEEEQFKKIYGLERVKKEY